MNIHFDWWQCTSTCPIPEASDPTSRCRSTSNKHQTPCADGASKWRISLAAPTTWHRSIVCSTSLEWAVKCGRSIGPIQRGRQRGSWPIRTTRFATEGRSSFKATRYPKNVVSSDTRVDKSGLEWSVLGGRGVQVDRCRKILNHLKIPRDRTCEWKKLTDGFTLVGEQHMLPSVPDDERYAPVQFNWSRSGNVYREPEHSEPVWQQRLLQVRLPRHLGRCWRFWHLTERPLLRRTAQRQSQLGSLADNLQ